MQNVQNRVSLCCESRFIPCFRFFFNLKQSSNKAWKPDTSLSGAEGLELPSKPRPFENVVTEEKCIGGLPCERLAPMRGFETLQSKTVSLWSYKCRQECNFHKVEWGVVAQPGGRGGSPAFREL